MTQLVNSCQDICEGFFSGYLEILHQMFTIRRMNCEIFVIFFIVKLCTIMSFEYCETGAVEHSAFTVCEANFEFDPAYEKAENVSLVTRTCSHP